MEAMIQEQQIGIMGGTFDPIHLGHTDMAEHCLRKFSLDKILFYRPGNPPHKKDTCLTDKADRLAMVRLATQRIDGFEVSDIEVKRNGPTYTLDTLIELSRQYREARFYYIIGADTLGELYSWHKIEEVAKRTRFIVVGRKNVEPEALHTFAARVRQDFDGQLIDAEYTGLDISSTLIRQRAAQGASLYGMVEPTVEAYIREHGLYGSSMLS